MNNIQFHLRKKIAGQNSDRNPEKNKGSGGEVCTNCLFKEKIRLDLCLALYVPFFLQVCTLAATLVLWLLFVAERCCH